VNIALIFGKRESVFTPGVPVLSVEAGTVVGWERYAHGSIGLHNFGASGPYKVKNNRFKASNCCSFANS